MPGFIHDKLEIKFLILYITARVIEPIPFDTVWDLAMCDEGVDYFSLTEAVGHMVETGQLERDEEQHYSITDKGRRNSEICESSLPYSVRMHCDENLVRVNDAIRRQAQVQADVSDNEDGTCTLHLRLDDVGTPLLQLELLTPSRPQAAAMAHRFQSDPTALYYHIVTLLTKPAEAKPGDDTKDTKKETDYEKK